MAGIFRHFIIACILSILIFLIFFGRVEVFPLILFILGNMIPDATFLPFIVLKYRTLNPKKIMKTKIWRIFAPCDEMVMFLMALFIFFVYPSFETSMLLIGVFVHIFIDLFMFEENIWW